MSRPRRGGYLARSVLAVTLLSAVAGGAMAGDTYLTNTDNEDNAGTGNPDGDLDVQVGNSLGIHPIEFNIEVNGALPASSAYLTIRGHDIDEEQGEHDRVFFNGTEIGALSGANEVWSTTALLLPTGIVQSGQNRVRIEVNSNWQVTVDWGQLVIDGGSAEHGDTEDVAIVGYAVDEGANTVTIDTQSSVLVKTSGDYRLELNLIAPDGSNSSVLSTDFSANAGETVVQDFSSTYPLDGDTGTYTIQAQLFYIDGGVPLQQDIENASFEHLINVGPQFPADPANSVISAAPTTITADGVSTATITLQAQNAFGESIGVGGDTVTLELAEPQYGSIGPVTDNGDGTYSAEYVSPNSIGAAQVQQGINGTLNGESAGSVQISLNLDPNGDEDGDGVVNQDEGADTNTDSDGDGTPDFLDPDDDGDGINTVLEGTGDDDGDGTPNYLDTDSDGDLIPDGDEGTADSDNDGLPNYLDTDSDGDGIADVTEGDGDLDGDGVSDYLDLDSDGDGVSDLDEGSADTDGDGTPDYLDVSADEDGDGIPDVLEGTNDTDSDGIPNYLDPDSDNDGLPDALEAGLSGTDSDNDGIDDALDVDVTGGSDTNGDGIDDNVALPDSDSDGIADAFDPDSDGDGLPDALEVGSSGLDSDSDGIDDRYDVDSTGGQDANGDGIDDAARADDVDRDGIPDYLDLDSDNDGISDSAEGDASGNDLNGNGIDDRYDADMNAAPDTDQDGVSDDAALPDTDNDGVADKHDLDSDNDTLLDVEEAGLPDSNKDGLVDEGVSLVESPQDTDNDGTADFRDLDSDNDGFNDITGGGDRWDADGDGVVDDIADADADGIPDVVDGDLGMRGSAEDMDGDGIPTAQDLDDDNDGIPDVVEGNDDLDGDGVPNRLDRDSDNDGLSDRFEAGLGTPTGFDSDNDGLDDAYDASTSGSADLDNDGAIDGLPDHDTDGDGIPDRLDVDSDNDGLSDREESVIVPTIDADTDGDGIDDSVDVDQTGGEDLNGDGVDDALLDIGGENGELPYYRNPDRDDDGIVDGDENGDFNGDGINDMDQKIGNVETALEGSGGGGSIGIYSLIGMLGLLVVSRRRWLGVVVVTLLAGQAQADEPVCQPDESFSFSFPGCWYAAGGIGHSSIEPDTNNTGWDVVTDSDQAYKVQLGYHFLPHWFAELSYTDLGDAQLQHRNPAISGRHSISYRAPALFAGYWMRDPKEALNIFAKLGMSVLETESSGDPLQRDELSSTQLALGVGAQWRFTERWFARAELDALDKDATYAGLSIGAYFGGSREKPRQVTEEVYEPVAPEEPIAPVQKPEPAAQAEIQPAAAVVSKETCDIFEGSLEGVHFVSGSAVLSDSAKTRLISAVEVLNAYPGLNISVEAHTDSVGREGINLELSKARAQSVVDYMVSQGVNAARMEAHGYGETAPVGDNATSKGRKANRRVELKSLQELQCN